MLWKKVWCCVSGDWCDWDWAFDHRTVCCTQHGVGVDVCSHTHTHLFCLCTRCSCCHPLLSLSLRSRTRHALPARSDRLSLRPCWSSQGTLPLARHPRPRRIGPSCLLGSRHTAPFLAGSVWRPSPRKPLRRRRTQPSHKPIRTERQPCPPSLCPASSIQPIRLKPIRHTSGD